MYGLLSKSKRFVNKPILVSPLLSATANSLSTKSSIVKQHDLNSSGTTSFTVSYLVNSCGLSLGKAKTVSQRVQFDCPSRPDSVLNVLRNNGFSNTHIAKLVVKVPTLLLSNVDDNLLPKLQFFKSIGLSPEECAGILSANPVILCRSLESHLVPTLNYLKSVIGPDELIIKAVKSSSWTFLVDVRKTLAPNITSLIQSGVPERRIPQFLRRSVGVFLRSPERFDKVLKEVIQKGYCTYTSAFMQAMHLYCLTNESYRESKVNLFKQWGISENDIHLLTKKVPQVLMISERKLASKLDFIVNKIGWQSEVIVKYPPVILTSLEKRLIPRCSVIKALQQCGLLCDKFSIGYSLNINDTQFVDKFVKSYMDEVPQLLDIYQRKKDILEFAGLKHLVEG